MVMSLRGPHEWRAPEIIAAYRQGAPIKKLRERFGVSDATVYRILKRHGVPVQQRGTRVVVPECLAVEIVRLYSAELLGQDAIGDRMGLSRQVITRTLRERGITIRARGLPRVPRCESCGQPIPRKLVQGP